MRIDFGARWLRIVIGLALVFVAYLAWGAYSNRGLPAGIASGNGRI